jgi:hypothetical protein
MASKPTRTRAPTTVAQATDPLVTLAGMMSSLPDTAPAAKGASTDKQHAMGETYLFDEPSRQDEARETLDELEAFEARLRGDTAPRRQAAPAVSSGRKPAAAARAQKAGSEYVANAVRAKRSEEEQEAEDARRAVRDIEHFQSAGGGPDSP